MSSALSEKATAIVEAMAELGAVFEISDIGPSGDHRWHWQPHPECMRNAIRKIWAAAEDRNAPGFNAAIVDAIRRHHGGARVR